MKMDELPENMTMPAASPEIFQQLGTLTRQLHDTLNMLGVLPDLKHTVGDLPDARSRLNYIAQKTEAAAEKVLNLVDKAKADQEHIAAETRKLAELITADPVKAVATGAVFNFVQDVEATTHRVDSHLTDIMMAQDFHDLTGQVVAKVVKLANDLESQLVKLLVQAAPPEQAHKVEAALTHSQEELNGPVVNPEGRTDVVSNQGEVDDLLASLGF
jgi:chemotaxis protein CheZ